MPGTGSLTDKRVVVTGGTRGIGRAIALAFAGAGADVCAVGAARRPEHSDLEAELRALSPRSFTTAADVGDDGEVKALVDEVGERFGGIDVLVNNAGIVSHRTLADLDSGEWERVLNVNLGGVYRTCRLADPLFADGASIVNVSSAVASVGMAGRTHYTAAKAGIVGFSRSLCKELGGRGIRVNVIAPGIIETDQLAHLDDAQRARYGQLAALGRLGRPEEIAGAALFLASQLSTFVNGAVLVVDGGI